jgi:hypothetical protein
VGYSFTVGTTLLIRAAIRNFGRLKQKI